MPLQILFHLLDLFQGPETFLREGPTVSVPGFAGRTVSVATTPLCQWIPTTVGGHGRERVGTVLAVAQKSLLLWAESKFNCLHRPSCTGTVLSATPQPPSTDAPPVRPATERSRSPFPPRYSDVQLSDLREKSPLEGSGQDWTVATATVRHACAVGLPSMLKLVTLSLRDGHLPARRPWKKSVPPEPNLCANTATAAVSLLKPA